jgi:hypothetical protein
MQYLEFFFNDFWNFVQLIIVLSFLRGGTFFKLQLRDKKKDD